MKSNKHKIILSLFDYSGGWSKPYRDAGYTVIQVDIKLGIDIFEVLADVLDQIAEHGAVSVYGILAAPVCTDFSASGAWCWKKKETQPAGYNNPKTIDFDNTVEHSIFMVLATLEIIERLNPVFYAIENPVGRIAKLVPEIGKAWYFQPYEFGDPYTKKTGIYGKFNKPVKTPVEPIKYCEQGSWTQKLGGKSERTKALRSVTPPGFAKAFFEANK
jgi:hypothetical protein